MKRKPKSASSTPTASARKRAEVQPEEWRELTDEAKAVRAAYKSERTRWESFKAGEPVDYSVPRRYNGTPPLKVDGELEIEKGAVNVWQRLANFFLEEEIDAASYITVLFDGLMGKLKKVDKRAPEPPQLLAKEYQEIWHQNKDAVIERIRVSLLIEKNRAEQRFSSLRFGGRAAKDAWASVLTDSSMELSPLFRYCIASRIGGNRFGRIAAHYESRAVMQFERYRPFYRKQWKALLPKGFAKRSRVLYPQLVMR